MTDYLLEISPVVCQYSRDYFHLVFQSGVPVFHVLLYQSSDVLSYLHLFQVVFDPEMRDYAVRFLIVYPSHGQVSLPGA